MKRYWKLIAIITVIVLTVGTFYIQSALSASDYPEVVFEKISGNADELKPITLVGNYHASQQDMGESVHVTTGGSSYSGEQSFFERLRGGFYSQDINQLQDKYRGFMRGKSGNIASYFETDSTLAYAKVINQFIDETGNNMAFDIAVLDKENDETTTFTVPVPNRAMYAQVYVEDVQLIDGELKVLTQNYSKDGGDAKYVYSFNLSEQDINGEEKIAVADQDENTRVHIRILPSSDIIAAHNYVVYAKTEEPIVREHANNQMNSAEKQTSNNKQLYVVYNLKTEKKKVVKLPKTLSGKETVMYKDTTLYLLGENKVTLYNLKTEAVESQTKLPSQTNSAEQEAERPTVNIANGKIYMLSMPAGMVEGHAPTLTVIDVQSGDVLYEGKLTTKKPLDDGESLYFSGMQIQ
ncbi:hypothetical protein FH966_05880 [Lentibacillus cibarius]|uniref:Uncharacterized protein n=1 Tax=Lentibacillus cibarius TaxID=2583219 RepID=A0A549YHC2_9BACI|nr:hypothetical protein [Lentibacillus cibarius]TRM11276.1 hypothetical protein FH966_05880 [Lentibacillus cibarius]